MNRACKRRVHVRDDDRNGFAGNAQTRNMVAGRLDGKRTTFADSSGSRL